jgi:biopolymer transport protein ExbB
MFRRSIFIILAVLFSHCVFAAETVNVEQAAMLDLNKVFQGAPVIYSILLLMSIFSFVLWSYSMLTLRLNDMMPNSFIDKIRECFVNEEYADALKACKQEKCFASSIIASGITSRQHGHQVTIEAIQSEGRRLGSSLWQRISILNDIAVISPMLGLLGTILGMFYAFYDVNQSGENISSIFDGLGIAIGTTVAGLVVAILATVFHTTLKFRLVRLLSAVEEESVFLGKTLTKEREVVLT